VERSFNDFFNGDWQSLLEAHRILPDEAFGYPTAEPYPVSWDRSAAWIVYNMMKGADMAKAPATRGRKPAVNDSAAKIVAALAFTKIAVKAASAVESEDYTSKVYMTGGWAFTHNGIIAAGMSLGGNDLGGYVEHSQLAAALSNVGKELTISSGEEGIEIKSGDYEVMVPAFDTEHLRPAPPDPIPAGGAPYPLGNAFREAMEVAGRVVKDTTEHLRDAAIYNLGTALLATNGIQVVEAFHGQNMPQGLVFPKAFATAINKTDKNIAGFTFDATGYKSFTVWFEDQSFIRTNLYPFADYPQAVVQKYGDMFANFDKLIDTPKGFFEAVEMVGPFGGENSAVAITGGAVCTDYREQQGWFTHKVVKGLPEGAWCSADLVLAFKDATKVFLGSATDMGTPLLFSGGAWRAAVAGIKRPMPAPIAGTVLTATAPDPATAPAWGAAPAATAAPAPGAAPPVAAPPAGGTLPFTPRSRQTSFHGAEGWDTAPYTLQPGETIEQFANETPKRWGGPGTPDEQRENPPVASAPFTGAPAFAAPVTTEAFAPAPVLQAAPVPTTPAASATFPSDTGGFVPFQQPEQVGAGFTANPVQSQSDPATLAPAGASAPWQTNVVQFPSEPAAPTPAWGNQPAGDAPAFDFGSLFTGDTE
jgi:hypothetical protein